MAEIKKVYYCYNCGKTVGRLIDNKELCSNCNGKMIQTAIDVDGWKNMDDEEKKYNLVTEEIKELKKVCGSHILKVIVETCNLSEDEKVEVCKCVSDAGADFIKTSTGFGSAGATIADVKLFKANIKPGVMVKAAGGIRTKEDLEAYVMEGVDRIGCSGAIKALK